MAVLNAHQLAEIRQELAREAVSVPWTKPKINAAIQAIENVFTSGPVTSALNTAINDATAPAVLTADEKRLLVRWVLKSRFERGNN